IKNITNHYKNIALIDVGGGITGAFLSFVFMDLFGKLGLRIIEIIGIIVCSFVLLDLDGKKLMRSIYTSSSELYSSSKDKYNEFKEKREFEKQLKASEEESEQIIINNSFDEFPNEEIEKNYSEQELVIIDYDKNSDSNEELVENKSEVENETIIESNEVTKNDDVEEIKPVIKKKVEKRIEYKTPPLSLLNLSSSAKRNDRDQIIKNSQTIEETMANFGINAKVTQVNTGPTITCYELVPDSGVKLSKIVNLADNLAFSLASQDIRIEAPIPGKMAVGIEVPNKAKSSVTLGEMIKSETFKTATTDLPLMLGKDVSGQEIISSIDDMPHLLIAGATGSGKSVCINSIILSLLYKSSPDDVKLILIDPKIVELSVYNGIPHLLIPVVTNPKKAASALNWAVEEMERRYKVFARNSVRDITAYNSIEVSEDDEDHEKLPKIVIIIDELSDLMMVAANEVEEYIARLAQMSRAAGIYLIIATQRPSVDVITGTIKANIPSRISFAVSSQIDSRTILDIAGAEKLLGKGDMLFYPSFYSKPKRIQGTFVTDKEVEKVVEHIKKNTMTQYNESVVEEINTTKEIKVDTSDPLLFEAIKIIFTDQQASISYLQRRLRIGYSRAARLIDSMEDMGVVGPSEGAKPRNILITEQEYLNIIGGTDE
ncbi:MAG: DNA translocase FtsK, partial [Tissierellia bacterium]|nr:DNA translocase FtsK [Tissierellia bacterium]